MVGPWSILSRALGADAPEGLPAAPHEAPRESLPRATNDQRLSAIGQYSEDIRERVVGLSDRLAEMNSLAGDFAHIVQPLNGILEQHAAVQSRVLEVDALLERERELSKATRAELTALQAEAAKTSMDLAAVWTQLKTHETLVRDQDSLIAQLRLRIEDQVANIESLDKQLYAETERARAVSDENQALRIELDDLDQGRLRAEREIGEARQIIETSEAEQSRLRQQAEALTHRLAGLRNKVSELEPQVQMIRNELAVLQEKFAAEQVAKAKAEAARDAERAAHEIESASLTMRIEGLVAQVTNGEKVLAHLRSQLGERSEELRIIEKSRKDVLAEKLAMDRRHEALSETSSRQAQQILELQKANAEIRDRCEMLTKAVGAKDALVEGGTRKIATLEARLEQMIHRLEHDREAFEATHRRLIEELQGEKAERSLAQGALDIARTSRSKLLAQYAALKRQAGGGGGESVSDEEHDRQPDPTNVTRLKT